MDYGSIGDISVSNRDINPKESLFVSDTTKFTFVFIYLSYLHDQQAFGFFLKCITQAIIISIPDIDDLPNLLFILSSSPSQDVSLNYQIEKINVIIKIIIPYIILDFLMTLILHLIWLYTSIKQFLPFSTFSNYINDITTNILDNTEWIYDSLFLDIIGQSSIINANSSISTSIYLLLLDITIFAMQLATVLMIKQRLNRLNQNFSESVIITVE